MQYDIMDAMDFFTKQKQELDGLNTYRVPLKIRSQTAEFNVAGVELADGENGIELRITLMEKKAFDCDDVPRVRDPQEIPCPFK